MVYCTDSIQLILLQSVKKKIFLILLHEALQESLSSNSSQRLSHRLCTSISRFPDCIKEHVMHRFGRQICAQALKRSNRFERRDLPNKLQIKVVIFSVACVKRRQKTAIKKTVRSFVRIHWMDPFGPIPNLNLEWNDRLLWWTVLALEMW